MKRNASPLLRLVRRNVLRSNRCRACATPAAPSPAYPGLPPRYHAPTALSCHCSPRRHQRVVESPWPAGSPIYSAMAAHLTTRERQIESVAAAATTQAELKGVREQMVTQPADDKSASEFSSRPTRRPSHGLESSRSGSFCGSSFRGICRYCQIRKPFPRALVISLPPSPHPLSREPGIGTTRMAAAEAVGGTGRPCQFHTQFAEFLD